MSFGDLWTLTMNDPDLSLRWTALTFMLQGIQTVLIFVSGFLVIMQIRQLNKDAIEKKIAGLKAAIEALDTDLFIQVSKEATSGNPIRGINWRRLLDSVNLVALLVEQGYTDSKLLLAMKGKALYAVGSYIQKNGLPTDLKDDADDQFKPAINFLNDICSQASKLGYVD
jgi:hypothetical protein